MKFQIFWQGNIWQTETVTYLDPSISPFTNGLVFDVQTKDGKRKVTLLAQHDVIITEVLNNIAVPVGLA